MLKSTITVLIAVALAGGVFASDAQARGGGGHLRARDEGQVGSLHEMHIPSEARHSRMSADFGRSRVSSDFGREMDLDRLHGDREFCHPDCGPYGCRYLWQYSCL